MVAKICMVLIFVGVAVGVGLYCRRTTTSVDGFVLGGRNVGPWMSAFAYGTSYFSAVVFVGYAGQFGFKYGIVLDGDLVFDVRFLPNPFYKENLKNHTGLESDVQEYVLKFEQTQEFIKKLNDMVDYLLPYYIEEGKSQLVIGIGCTGGKHRSVTIAIKLYEYLKEKGYNAIISHRDIQKDKY